MGVTLLTLPSSKTTLSISPPSTLNPTLTSLFAYFAFTLLQPTTTMTLSTSSPPPSLRLFFTTTHSLPPFAAPNNQIVALNSGVPPVKVSLSSTQSLISLWIQLTTWMTLPPLSSKQLVPNLELKEEMEHPFMLKLTILKCGGFTLGVATHHWLCDRLGGSQVVNAIAELARGSTRITVEPIWDRERLLGPRNPPRVDFPLVGEFLCLDKGFSPGEEVVGSILRECFHVTDESLDGFKKSLFDQSGFNFTTFEALGAYVWRSKMKALGVKANEKVKFAYSINIRRLLKPPLPIGYWGNGCVAMFAQLSAKDLIEQPILKTAELIRKSKSNVSEEYVRSFIDYQKLHFAEGVATGKWVTWFMDWRHLGHSTVDFGWGGPISVLPLGINSVDLATFCLIQRLMRRGRRMASRFW